METQAERPEEWDAAGRPAAGERIVVEPLGLGGKNAAAVAEVEECGQLAAAESTAEWAAGKRRDREEPGLEGMIAGSESRTLEEEHPL